MENQICKECKHICHCSRDCCDCKKCDCQSKAEDRSFENEGGLIIDDTNNCDGCQ